jgi:26S proteasome regulatory subunit N11
MRPYVNLVIWYIVLRRRKNELEELMLLSLSKKTWTDGLLLEDFENHTSTNEKVVKELQMLADR